MIEDYLQRIMLLIPPVLLALSAHECAHGWVAGRLGDPTARMLGRVTLNPIKHLDPIGTLAIFLTGLFGWAKPVPVNPRNFRDPTRAMMWVALAGPATNLFLAAVFAGVFKVMVAYGGAGFASSSVTGPLFLMVWISVRLNVALAIFNMLPLPPLDGSKVLTHLLPTDKAISFSKLEPYGFVILMVLIMTGIVHEVMSPLIMITVKLLIGGMGGASL